MLNTLQATCRRIAATWRDMQDRATYDVTVQNLADAIDPD